MSQLASYKQKNDEILSYIDELNKIESEFTQKLEVASDPATRGRLEESIQLVQQTRGNLTNALGSLNSYYSTNLQNSGDTLRQQEEAVAIIDREMQLAKARLGYINKQKDNKMRQVEINQYYNEYYLERTELIKWVMLAIAIGLAYIYLQYRVTAVPPVIYNIISVILVGFFGYKILMLILSINARSKMMYQEYSWSFNKDKAPDIPDDGYDSNKDPFKRDPSLAGCADNACCDTGTTWNANEGVCQASVSADVSSLTSKCSPAALST